MIDILNIISPYFYVGLVVGSVIFGVSLAVNLWVHKTISKIRKEADNNFSSSLSFVEQKEVNFAINNAKKDYYKFVDKNKKRKKNHTKTIEISEDENSKIDEVFLTLIKDVYKPFSVQNGKERGYLSFTKNEIFKILHSLLHRIDEILSKSGVNWVKNVKVSLLANGVSVYASYKSFVEKLWVSLIIKTINFFMWFFRFFSPVSITKYLIKDLSNQNLSILVYDTLVELVGKELAVIYKVERSTDLSSDKNYKKVV